jgi:CarD family transcriptional regulator
MPKNWNRRFKHNRDKMKTGDILELAEVVRNLSLRDREKGLSTGEKQMFVKAKKILASELMYAKDMDEEEAAEWLDGVLVGANANGRPNGRKKTAAKPAKVASKNAKPAARKPATRTRKSAAKPAAKSKPKTKARAAAR